MLEEILPIFLALVLLIVAISVTLSLFKSPSKLRDHHKKKSIFDFLFKLKNWKIESREQNDKEDLR